MNPLLALEAVMDTEPKEFNLAWAMHVTTLIGKCSHGPRGLVDSRAACHWARRVTADQFRAICGGFIQWLEWPTVVDEDSFHELMNQCNDIRQGAIRIMLPSLGSKQPKNSIEEFQRLMEVLDETW